MATIEVKVPDLGGFDNIPVISILVKPGDTIAKEAPLVELESDKATMEVPASAAGTVRDIKVKIGDKVSQGSVLVSIESAYEAASAKPVATPQAPPTTHAEPEHAAPVV